MITGRDRYRGCLLGGAVGDALGAGIEFASLADIRRQYGPAGVTGYVPCYGRCGRGRLRLLSMQSPQNAGAALLAIR